MRTITIVVFILAAATSCQAQHHYRIPGACETCELIEVGKPSRIHSVDTSAGWTEPGQKLLVSGKVYKLDGKTPAPGVIVYYWQTDNNGLYSPSKTMDKGAERHGHIRGWVKTDTDGNYAIYTVKPAPYPNTNNPAHIHILIKEPDIENAYYIDEFIFDDDPLVTSQMRNSQSKIILDFKILISNLTNPTLLFFVLGIIATIVKSDLEIPRGSVKFISLCLLFAIGFKGG